MQRAGEEGSCQEATEGSTVFCNPYPGLFNYQRHLDDDPIEPVDVWMNEEQESIEPLSEHIFQSQHGLTFAGTLLDTLKLSEIIMQWDIMHSTCSSYTGRQSLCCGTACGLIDVLDVSCSSCTTLWWRTHVLEVNQCIPVPTEWRLQSTLTQSILVYYWAQRSHYNV